MERKGVGIYQLDNGNYEFRYKTKINGKPVVKRKRTDEEGNFIWPGFGDNLRALLWALGRCENTVGAKETPLGFIPRKEDLDLTDLDITDEALEEILTVDPEIWKEEVKGMYEWYSKFDHMPDELKDSLRRLESEL